MKTLDEQDHYEVLEVPWGAKEADIDRAYRIAQSAYAQGSLALYSMFEQGDANVIRERIEQAHHVLSNETLRAEYDAQLIASGARKPEPEGQEPPPHLHDPLPDEGIVGRVVVTPRTGKGSVSGPVGAVTTLASFDDIDQLDAAEEEDDAPWSGERLRLARLRRGIELEEIHKITKVSQKYLCCLEEDRYAELPAPVYVRGFVGSYARAIGLDPKATAASYMQQMEQAAQRAPRSRLRGRH